MNHLRIDRERYMKHVVTDLNDPNEPVMFNNSILGNYSYETFFGNFIVETSSLAESNTQYGILHCTHIIEPNCNIIVQTNSSFDVKPNTVSKDRLEMLINSTNPTKTKKYENLKSNFVTKKGDPNMWTLFFDGSKSLEGVGFILKDLKGRKTLISCILRIPMHQ
jgi:hypothetical protein